MTALIEFARASLLAAGLARCETQGSVYFTGGSGKTTIVLLHGVNDQAGTWAQVVPALVKEHRLIVPDLAGHGDSEPKTGPIPLPLIVERVHAILEKEGAGKVTLVGNSMGAWVSMLYTLAHPERVERLVLESAAGLAIPPAVPLSATTRDEAMVILRAVHGPDATLPDWAPDALIARNTNSQMMRVVEGGVFGHFLDAKLSQLKVPVTILWGAHDGVVPRSYVDKLLAGISGAQLKVIDGAAHIPHTQQPERFVECLRATF